MNSINRETIVINLDPAVKSPDAAIDICALGLVLKFLVFRVILTIEISNIFTVKLILKICKVEHAEVMEEMELGPNGGLIFCMELLLENKGNVVQNKIVYSDYTVSEPISFR